MSNCTYLLKIEIEDNGPGIADEDIHNIFHPFTRGREATGKSGYGVGLAYVKSVIEKHNGSVMVHSEPGRGTKFTIFLPIVKENVLNTGIEKAIPDR